jgi:hypothetical protein
MSQFYIGCDLGQSNDPTAIAVVQRIGDEFRCGHLERLPLGMSYVSVVHHVGALMQHPTVAGNVELAVDATGCGRPVCDLFSHAGIAFTAVVITAGHTETAGTADNYRGVPKVTLVSHIQALLHAGKLKIRADLPEAETLISEIENFKVSYSQSGFMSFSAREGAHDDLVLALAIAIWAALRQKTGQESWDTFLKQQERDAIAAGFDRDAIQVPDPDWGFGFGDKTWKREKK